MSGTLPVLTVCVLMEYFTCYTRVTITNRIVYDLFVDIRYMLYVMSVKLC